MYQNVTCTVRAVVVSVSPPGKGHGVAFVADVQTKGRGSKGRVWQAKHSSNIYVSFIIHRPALEVVNCHGALKHDISTLFATFFV